MMPLIFRFRAGATGITSRPSNQFYHDFSILNEPDEQKKAVRLMIAKNVAKIIKNGMALLGIEVPERM